MIDIQSRISPINGYKSIYMERALGTLYYVDFTDFKFLKSDTTSFQAEL